MQTHSQPKFRRLAIVTAVLAALPAAFAQQGAPDRVLPPPSLYDELMPAEKAAAPAPAKPAAPAAAEATAAQPKQPAPAKAAPEKAATKPADAGEPWYKSMFSWFGGSSGETKPAQSKMMAAPSSSSAATADVTAARGEYAYYEANKVVRTAFGQCVKTGLWAATSPNAPCEPGMAAKKPAPKPTTVAAAAPTAAVAPKPEPVEVQRLAPAPVREERALEPEPVAAPTPAPAPAPPKPPVESMNLSADALFPLSSATLKPTAKERLDALAAKMMTLDYKTIRVVGHTDPTGSPELNEKLSRKRAEAVKQYLVSRGVDPKRIVTEGMGSAMPMVTEIDCSTLPRAKKIACYQPDRRVEIEVTGALPKTGSAAKPSVAGNQ